MRMSALNTVLDTGNQARKHGATATRALARALWPAKDPLAAATHCIRTLLVAEMFCQSLDGHARVKTAFTPL